MKFIKLLSLLCFLIFANLSLACSDEANWIISEATIKNVQKLGDNKYKYDLIYNIKNSDKLLEDDKYIKNPVEHTISNIVKAPIENQIVKIRYMTNDPENFEIIGEVKYK